MRGRPVHTQPLARLALAAALLVGAPVAALSADPPAADAPAGEAPQTFSDPFAYCRAVGTIDAPDARYTGPAMPEAIARGLAKAFEMPGHARIEPFEEHSVWRCMDGKVYACNIGANIPCGEKADVSRTPTAAMVSLCKDNPTLDAIPAFVTGRATVYLWSCVDGKPVAGRAFTEPDARGFLANAWHEIAAP